MENKNLKFETWAVVELFGHTQLAGLVSTETIAAQEFVRIDVPETSDCPAFTKYHLPTAVYGITPVNEEYAIEMAGMISAKPLNDYKHHQVIEKIVQNRISVLDSSQKLLDSEI